MPAVLIALLIAAALGGGTAAVADRALPGDTLWNFKVGVNENVRGYVVTGEKADWNMSIVTMRLDEAQTLLEKGAFTADTQAALTANLNTHIKNIFERVTLLRAADETTKAADIAANFQAVLVRHTAGLTKAPASFLTYMRGLFDEAANLQ